MHTTTAAVHYKMNDRIDWLPSATYLTAVI